jgi:hypothetical protein
MTPHHGLSEINYKSDLRNNVLICQSFPWRSSPNPVCARKGTDLDQSDILMVLGVVLALAFVAQTLTRGRRIVPQLIGVGLVMGALGGYVVYRHREQTRKAQEQATKWAEFESRIAQFTIKHNAVTDWQRPLLAKEAPRIYTAELTPLLVRMDGRPIFLFASLRNVSESDGRTVIYFDEATSLESQFKLQLDCSPNEGHFVISDDTAYRFAVIAQIQSVEYVVAGDYSLATGRCVDVMPVSLGDYLEFVVEPEVEKQLHHEGE